MLIDLFPVRIYKHSVDIQDTHRKMMREYLTGVFKYINPSNHILEKGGKSTHEVDRELHLNPIFKQLTDFVDLHCKHYFNSAGFSHTKPKIVSMWANLHIDGDETLSHTHSTHILAGCYYLDFPNNAGNLVFKSPNEYTQHYYPYSEEGKIKDLKYTVDCAEGDLVLFPAHLKHYTEKNNSGQNRISINFNIDHEAN